MAATGSQGNAFVFTNSDMPLEQAQNVWTGLRKGINQIQEGNASSLRYEELYRNAYTLVLHKHGSLLHDGVVQTIQEKLDVIAESDIDPASDDQLVRILVSKWDKHKLTMTMIRDVLMYMDKTFCEREGRLQIFHMGVNLFRKTIIMRPACKDRLQSILLRSIECERHSETIDQDLIKHCLSMLVECGNCPPEYLNLYEQLFETVFLEETRQFYKKESAEFISQNTVPDYLKKIEQRLIEEDARADHYLHCDTKSRLLIVCHEELISQCAQTLAENPNTGCQNMFEQYQIADLRRMYSLFKRVPSALGFISDCMKVVVRNAGVQAVHDQDNKKDPHKFVQSCLDLRSKFFTIVQNAFDDDRTFAKCLKDAFEHFINLNSRAAQYLALYIDGMLKKGLRWMSEDEVECKLEEVVTIFRYITDKDVFEEFYKLHLAHRLLTNTHISNDVEKTIIAKLKAECGHQFTSKLEGMFKNIELSHEVNEGYQAWPAATWANKQIFVNVLTSGFWPFSETPECKLPACVEASCTLFGAYYKSKHSGHKIAWQTSLGIAELNVCFRTTRKELIVHTYQMCILMLFNDTDSLTYAEIQSLTCIPSADLQRHLLSLAHPKVRVLLKSPNTKVIGSDHVFSFNMNYTSCLYRVRIPLLQANTSESQNGENQSSADIPEAVAEARKNRVDASIVRILKARRTIEHSLLIAEVHKQLQTKFKAEPSLIKRRIEALIEREYLERDKDDRRTYHYLA
uniref:Cullin family profile domain-containing protein n=1 Tax=Spongospora subterranea TaxID=70186 RepID=A0A0H5R8J1_9EUKA|eukprot:CRZ10121.1 hypothetical protein [Spongospora subterranea]